MTQPVKPHKVRASVRHSKQTTDTAVDPSPADLPHSKMAHQESCVHLAELPSKTGTHFNAVKLLDLANMVDSPSVVGKFRVLLIIRSARLT